MDILGLYKKAAWVLAVIGLILILVSHLLYFGFTTTRYEQRDSNLWEIIYHPYTGLARLLFLTGLGFITVDCACGAYYLIRKILKRR